MCKLEQAIRQRVSFSSVRPIRLVALHTVCWGQLFRDLALAGGVCC